jgi:FkbM family methyltransferase
MVPQSAYVFINTRVAAKDIIARRRWEPELDLLSNFVRFGDTVLDIGGNHGLYAYHLSRLVGPSGRVHTFEPLPPNLTILKYVKKRCHLNNVTVHPYGCGEKPGREPFCVPLDHGIPQLGWGRQGTDGLRFDCEIVKLDDTIESRVSFLKIDIEGAELFALRGAQRILRESRPVILIEADNHTVNFGYAQQVVFDFLSQLGYSFFTQSLEPRKSFSDTGNYFCLSSPVEYFLSS